MTPTLARSYAYCERLARREAKNFYYAFRVLPGAQRRAMCALYAFLRVADDLSDQPGDLAAKRTRLAAWHAQFDQALAGSYHHPLHPAFHDTVRAYAIPRPYLAAVLDGVAMDLVQQRYATFDDLYRYCYRVASAVGLACIRIWGFEDPRAEVYAESAGIAFQLTNILRDLGEDAARDRVYLPGEDLERFGYDESRLRRQQRDAAFQALMRFEVERARRYYEAAQPLAALLRPAGRAVYLVMTRTYRGLLEAIEKRNYDVFSSRVTLSPWHKLGLAVQVLPVRFGWA
jgi:phytoene synthase